ncbi:glycosyltransferase [Moritella sp. F3]|uniref:glycosyltransferase n=1 Tax=Moritella sp. F3 TaxID=2718882 RepID=UPI0018E125C6|nr:glycosyltransferase [Moritella sp. F3]GIC77285.1 glycosyl transferase [Moritella sp. F1]GIC83187.1 glycosyl transferase [Moritella sp. F3]
MNKKRHVVFILPAINGGGAEKVVLNLYKAMEEFENCTCHIISLSNETEYNIANFDVHFIDALSSINKNGFIKRLLYKSKMANKIDEFIINNFGCDSLVLSNMISSDKVMSKSNLNVYHIIHSEYHKTLFFKSSLFKKIKTKINIQRIYKYHPLIFISNGVKDSFEQIFKQLNEHIVIYNPIDIDNVISLANDNIKKIEDNYIIHIGRFNRVKRHDRLLEEFAKVNTNCKLVLAGSGSLKDKIIKKINELNIKDKVILLGFKENPYPYLKNSKGLIISSDSEGLPMVILEAMALNVPVLSTDCSAGIRELLGEKSTCLIPMDNIPLISQKIDDMLITPSKYTLKVSSKFTPKLIAKQYHNLK